ncbi:MAG: hypothetical protein JSV65_19625 [Armatimonadota bacterium]|nr:MAG: hypothetical protein JSV65_19625 [Armatimonadota bacterium]
MSTQAAFAEVDITPPLGTKKIGWLKEIVGDSVLDPLFARAAVIQSGAAGIAFIQLDTLSIRWTTTNEIRRRIEQRCGFPGASVMAAATHNHAGPAVATTGEVPRDDAYIEMMVSRIVDMFCAALDNLQPAEIGIASAFEWNVAHNRRVVMRDGTVQTHGRFPDPNALYIEGPIDPEVAVLAARSSNGEMLGAIVNFACHPTHHGPEPGFSAGFPGVLAREMKSRGCPVTLFLNGASGNIHTADPTRNGADVEMEAAGLALADDVSQAMTDMSFRAAVRVGCAARTVELPFRKATEDEVRGTIRGAQRFVDPTIYDRTMPRVLERIRECGVQLAEVQALFVDDYAFVSMPAEYFVQLGLRIKEESHPRHALVVSCANGMVGYVPHREAFLRGGYETTFTNSSRLAPEAGDLLADCAIEIIRAGCDGAVEV